MDYPFFWRGISTDYQECWLMIGSVILSFIRFSWITHSFSWDYDPFSDYDHLQFSGPKIRVWKSENKYNIYIYIYTDYNHIKDIFKSWVMIEKCWNPPICLSGEDVGFLELRGHRHSAPGRRTRGAVMLWFGLFRPHWEGHQQQDILVVHPTY